MVPALPGGQCVLFSKCIPLEEFCCCGTLGVPQQIQDTSEEWQFSHLSPVA